MVIRGSRERRAAQRALLRSDAARGFRLSRSSDAQARYLALKAIAAGGATSLLSSIDGPGYTEGWGGQYIGTPPTLAPASAPVTVSVARQGYTAAGAVTSYTDSFILTQRIRKIYPDDATLTDNGVALQDYIYSTDIVDGGVCTNNSTLTSPVPICNWATHDRTTVGNTLTGEITAWHRNARSGRQVPCVIVTATDGTTTVSTTVSTVTISAQTGDAHAVLVYAWSLDITTLTDQHLVTVNAVAYPWIGAAASLADSSTSSVRREFSPRWYRKDTGKVATVPIAVLDPAGNDSTGTWATTEGAADALPFLTFAGARTAINHATRGTPVTGGICDGAEIRCKAGSFVIPNAGALGVQRISAITVTKHSTATQANAIVTFGTAAANVNFSGSLATGVTTQAIIFKNVTVQRTGAGALTGAVGARCEWIFENIIWDTQTGADVATAWGSNADIAIHGMTGLGVLGATFAASSNGRLLCARGITADFNNQGIDGWLVLGNAATRINGTSVGSQSASGSIVAFNSWLNPSTSNAVWALGLSADVTGAVFAQNLIEYDSASDQATLKPSADSFAGSTTHVIMHHNTVAGSGARGRSNVFYDEKPNVNRTQKLMSTVGEIWVCYACKGDQFVGTNGNGTPDPTDAPNHTGHLAYSFGVGCRGMFTQYLLVTTQAFLQAYPGLQANHSASTGSRNDPGFTNFQAVTFNGVATYTAGAGGGDYHIGVGGAARGMVVSPVLSHDLDGVARAASNDCAGCYA